MSTLKVAALAAALAGGVLALTPADAQAQNWGHPGYTYGHRAPQPQYVHPKILRKQAELQERVYRKYGYVQPYYGHGNPHHYRHHYQPRGYGYGYGW